MDAGAKLEYMANQIAAFFHPYSQDEAVTGVHDHIVAFWSPAMRRDLAARAVADPAPLDPLVVAALHALGTGRSPARKALAGPEAVGAIDASDAG